MTGEYNDGTDCSATVNNITKLKVVGGSQRRGRVRCKMQGDRVEKTNTKSNFCGVYAYVRHKAKYESDVG